MATNYTILQPPFTDIFTLLVDDISEYKNWGTTSDMNKISYNLALMGEEHRRYREIYSALSDDGITYVLPLGRFITIVQLKRDETKGQMTFFDFDVLELSPIVAILEKTFSKQVIGQWMEIHTLLEKDFTEEMDIVVIEKL